MAKDKLNEEMAAKREEVNNDSKLNALQGKKVKKRIITAQERREMEKKKEEENERKMLGERRESLIQINIEKVQAEMAAKIAKNAL